VTSLHLANTYFLKGDLETAVRTADETAPVSLAAGHWSVYLSTMHLLALICQVQGRLHEAEAIFQRAIAFVQQQPGPIWVGIEHLGLADILRERNDFDGAQAHLTQGLSLAEHSGDLGLARVGYLTGAHLRQSQADWPGALRYLDQAEQVTPAGWHAASQLAHHARLALRRGEIEAALRWAHSLRPVDAGLYHIYEWQRLTLARVWIASGDFRTAEALLRSLRETAREKGRWMRVMEVDILLTRCHWQQGRAAQALDSLGCALAMGAPENYIRLFVDEGEPIQAALSAFQPAAPASQAGYVWRLLAAFHARRPGPLPEPAVPLPDPLSPRELEVLRLLATGHSYQEIAQRLVLALSTVQGYVRSLYRKLGAHSGRQAVACARTLRLIS
jgi:LuxR family maltose regulon positive regulatory protein